MILGSRHRLFYLKPKLPKQSEQEAVLLFLFKTIKRKKKKSADKTTSVKKILEGRGI